MELPESKSDSPKDTIKIADVISREQQFLPACNIYWKFCAGAPLCALGLRLWATLDPADFARGPSTVISSRLHSKMICWGSPLTTVWRWVIIVRNVPQHVRRGDCVVLMVRFVAGGFHCLPESQKSGQAAVSEQPRRSLEFKKTGGLLQHLTVLPVKG